MKERAQCSLVSFGQAGALGQGPRWVNSHAAEKSSGENSVLGFPKAIVSSLSNPPVRHGC